MVVRVADRDAVQVELERIGVQTGVHYPLPAHRMPAFVGVRESTPRLPHTEAACREVLTLPFFPGMLPSQVERVCCAVAQATAT